LNDEDAARLAGELPIAQLKLRAQQYLDDCELHNKPNTLAAKGDALDKFFGISPRTTTPHAPKKRFGLSCLTSKTLISYPVAAGTWRMVQKRSVI
jgi:hypothetical protein